MLNIVRITQNMEKVFTKKCLCRKPNNQMITNILKNWNIDKENSFIGDSETDLAAAKKSRIKFIKKENNEDFKDLFLKIQKNKNLLASLKLKHKFINSSLFSPVLDQI